MRTTRARGRARGRCGKQRVRLVECALGNRLAYHALGWTGLHSTRQQEIGGRFGGGGPVGLWLLWTDCRGFVFYPILAAERLDRPQNKKDVEDGGDSVCCVQAPESLTWTTQKSIWPWSRLVEGGRERIPLGGQVKVEGGREEVGGRRWGRGEVMSWADESGGRGGMEQGKKRLTV